MHLIIKGDKGRKGMNAIGATPVADATGAAPQKISFAKILRLHKPQALYTFYL